MELRARIEAAEAGIARLKALEREGRAAPAIVADQVRERQAHAANVAPHPGGHADLRLRETAALALRLRRLEIEAERE